MDSSTIGNLVHELVPRPDIIVDGGLSESSSHGGDSWTFEMLAVVGRAIIVGRAIMIGCEVVIERASNVDGGLSRCSRRSNRDRNFHSRVIRLSIVRFSGLDH